ncbi:hypothetical protein F2Q68_00008340 [Brassica cretica]|uniref:Uncharacterized protein n=1 Tax=Brassica cretica TaxID=69181 RepID=A0A8S9KUY1_BRACR|nr:hypothetical protein F2Q68_00008340 [Brassica cretica]
MNQCCLPLLPDLRLILTAGFRRVTELCVLRSYPRSEIDFRFSLFITLIATTSGKGSEKQEHTTMPEQMVYMDSRDYMKKKVRSVVPESFRSFWSKEQNGRKAKTSFEK